MADGITDPSLEAMRHHLDWSSKQRRILTANGTAEGFYCAERGYDYDTAELPHHFLMHSTTLGSTRRMFENWRETTARCPIVGAWSRPLFYGGWEHSTDRDEAVFNLQTGSLFIDLRVPLTRKTLLEAPGARITCLEDMDALQLACYARQHIFAGFSKAESQPHPSLSWGWSCTRHHCIDWNFVGVGRTRPNKWWVELGNDAWKEWAFATDLAGQHYYCERWERYCGSAVGPVVALRKSQDPDGVIVIVGDHFNYCLDRSCSLGEAQARYPSATSLVDLVDAALAQHDLKTARACLSIQGGHGRISKGWQLDCAIEFWKQGRPLWNREEVSVTGISLDDCIVLWKGEEWSVFECSLDSPQALAALLRTSLSSL
ncbi:unnamed protein product [Effrenium voratum]|uniref:Uncharacterized protein n=1 Tax=Effrenium voratum TaxID=2562239 RepID=A0AA36J645_9DINO|nr:unnamed protein product [Effrenium voratum]